MQYFYNYVHGDKALIVVIICSSKQVQANSEINLLQLQHMRTRLKTLT